MAGKKEKAALRPADSGLSEPFVPRTEMSTATIKVMGNLDSKASPLIHDVIGEYGLIHESLRNNILTFDSYTKDKHECHITSCSQFPFYAQPPLHKHNFSELGLVLDGVVGQHVEGNHLTHRAGQGFIMNRNVAHTEEFIDNFHIVFLELPEEALSHILRRNQFPHPTYPYSEEILHFFLSGEESPVSPDWMLLEFSPVVPSQPFSHEIQRILDQLAQEMLNRKPGYSDLCDGMILRLLSILDDSSLFHKQFYQAKARTSELAFNMLTEYLIQNCGRFSRKDLETELHYSAGYLNKVCKMYTGNSLVEYGQYFSMKEAERLLLKTDLSVSEIVTRLGYANRHYFNQVFRAHFSVSPSQHRENLSQALRIAK